jgi:hypothetical protein
MPTPRIYSLCGATVQAKGLKAIDFSTELSQQLHKDIVWDTGVNKGQPLTSMYYQNATRELDGSITYDTPICKIDWTFYRDAGGFILQVVKLLQWYNDDDTLAAETKDIGKTYDPFKDTAARMDEVIQRRTRIVEDVKLQIGGMLYTVVLPGQDIQAALDVGRVFLAKHGNAIGAYRRDANMQLLADLANDDTPWLDTIISADPLLTIRDKVILDLTI